MKQYEKYKDSGVEWLGEIPEHWTFERMKHIGQVSFSSVDRHELVTEKSVKVCHYPVAYKNESVDNNTTFPSGTCTESEYANFQLLKGDIILTKDSETANDIGVPCFVKETIENCVCGYHLAQLRVNEANKINEAYLFRYIQSKNVSSHFETSCNGVTRFGLGKPIIENLLLLKPTIKEQQIIANYLDHTTSTIDKLISEKESLITKLQEKRKALINEVVTKGLNPNAPMRDSGTEWLGMIPGHWGINELKRYVDFVQTGTTPSTEKREYFENPTFNWFTPSDFCDNNIYLEESKRKVSEIAVNDQACRVFPENTVLLIGIGATLGKVGISKNKCSANQQINAIIFNHDINPVFGAYYLSSIKEIIVSMANAATLAILNQSNTKEIHITCPPIEEQSEIVNFIESRTIKIDAIVGEIQFQLQKLKEYKTAVISEVVTGKVDVREWKAQT